MAKNSVTIKVDTDFFERTFEPRRQRLERNLGIRVSQAKFVEILAKGGMKPGTKRMNAKFLPKKKR